MPDRYLSIITLRDDGLKWSIGRLLYERLSERCKVCCFATRLDIEAFLTLFRECQGPLQGSEARSNASPRGWYEAGALAV